jgi:rubredoxin
MYKKGVALELQFPANRLVQTGDATEGVASVGTPSEMAQAPAYALSLDASEARALLDSLRQRLAAEDISAPAVLSLAEQDASALAASADATTDAILLAASGATAAAAAVTLDASEAGRAADVAFKQWVCVICGWIYDEEAGLPEEGIAPGTRFEDIPDDWRCPLCDVGKEDFAVVAF